MAEPLLNTTLGDAFREEPKIKNPCYHEDREYVDEIKIETTDGVLRFHFYTVPRYKQSRISGSQWRTSAACSFYFDGKEEAVWAAHKVDHLLHAVIYYFDKYLHEIPRTRRDARLEDYEYMARNAKGGVYYDSDDDQEYTLEPRSVALEHHKGDDEICDYIKTSYRLPKEDRERLIKLCAGEALDTVIECFCKGTSCHRSTLRVHNILSALACATVTDDCKFPPGHDEVCFQPGCNNPHTVEYLVTKCRFKPHKKYYECFRRFCDEHKDRGDQGLDDSNDNYTVKGVPLVKRGGGEDDRHLASFYIVASKIDAE